MAQWIVEVQGKIVVEADDADAAKEIAKGALALRQSWLSPSYGTPANCAAVDMPAFQPLYDETT